MNIKKIRPMFTSIVTTKNKWGIDEIPKSTIIDPKQMQGSLKEYQTVVAVGPMVRDIKVGDVVMVNPSDYAVYEDYKPGDGMRQKLTGKGKVLVGYDIPTVELDGVEHMLLKENDITYVIEEFEEDKGSGIIIPDKSVIVS